MCPPPCGPRRSGGSCRKPASQVIGRIVMPRGKKPEMARAEGISLSTLTSRLKITDENRSRERAILTTQFLAIQKYGGTPTRINGEALWLPEFEEARRR